MRRTGGKTFIVARRFSEVVGLDYVPSLLEEGRERARAEGWQVGFRYGDAEAGYERPTSQSAILRA